MAHEARSPQGEVLVSGSSVQVMYDYAAQASTTVPTAIRSALEAWDGPFPEVSDRVAGAGKPRD